MPQLLLSTAYLPPIDFFRNIKEHENIIIEQYETYPKQTYRNRCEILSANGKLALTIPVNKKNGNHTLTKDIEITYSTNWQKIHWRAIESAYNNSPFFLYYADLFYPFYLKKNKYLIDYNNELLELILKILKANLIVTLSKKYEKEPLQTIDLRETIHPKKNGTTPNKNFLSYNQVFLDKFGFVPNLSVIDLIFNEGKFCKDYL